MKTMTVPDFSTPTIGRKRYKQFRGVDYSTDETQIDDGRSPRAVNVIADEGGAPERRWGWRTVLNLGGNRPVAGIFLYEATTETGRTMIVHAGDTLYKVRLNTDTYQPIAAADADDRPEERRPDAGVLPERQSVSAHRRGIPRL